MTTADSPRATSFAGPGEVRHAEVSRDTDGNRRLRPSSRPYEDIPRDLPAELVAEYRAVLSELDWLVATLRVPPEAEPSPPRAAMGPREVATERPRLERRPPDPIPEPDDRWGEPSPYLDERLAAARVFAANLSNEFGRIERRTRGLRGSVADLQTELNRASEELAFLRSNGGFDGPEDEDEPSTARRSPLPPPSPEARVRAASAPTARTDPLPAFGGFTAARYDATVRDTQSRHGRVAAFTVALAVAISSVLLTLTYFSHEAMPVWWLAVLPVVWMIPVPFFLISFRSTHRLLRRERLELSEAA
jgi:hypothetical protein